MTAPDKPELSNEEFIKKWRRMTMSDLSLAQRRGEDAEAFWQALDRLEALIGQGQEERDRKVFEAGYEAFCTKHYTLDQAWDDFAAADAAKKEGGK